MTSTPASRRESALALSAATVRKERHTLIALSHSLHAEPETAMREYRSAAKIAAIADDAGFTVTREVADLPTAFVATYGTGDLVIALCAEYDALPGIGHACGHNVNGAASTGAALALACVADLVGITVKLIGTPAEEDIGGKALLLAAGVFDDVAAAFMAHAADEDSVGASSLAIGAWDVVYHGKPAHAALAPWKGVNALDAVTLARTAVGLLRQQLPPSTMIHDIVLEAGTAVNVIPDTARARYELRARTTEDLDHARRRVRACLEAAALATGAELQLTAHGADFADLRQDDFLTDAYTRAARALGRAPVDRRGELMASTDMGNISHLVPALHPTIGYDTHGAHHHTAPFAQYGTSPQADRAVLDAATALAHTGIELATDPTQRDRCLHLLAHRNTP
ncbi:MULTISPECIES: amidohydrolase [unclassified Streptomyces]|uniref:amidohydrolase n=1 Tax=unclassified Streptomyces TaxID=2593676 RepID=UPI000DB8FFA6|nr:MULTISPECIES: amidohydrolase [unclassified Streptomyces]MYT72478.1 amidohydrolase [Streptomyces sp. SID8367]RAJ70625.1 amidohydrolase [Streptomyces sp. PsTaAH-137]